MKTILIYFLCTFLLSKVGFTQLADTENTLQLKHGAESPAAAIDQVSWIAGHWQGEAFGGIAEEFWSPPAGGSMMCVFRLINDEKISFYEICTITEEKGSLMVRLKHFNPDLKGWEEKDETVDFPLVKISGDRAYFSGFTFERINDQKMNIYVQIGEEPGQEKEVKFSYTRKK